ncbi:MAG: FkbM family methyltransferase [Pseudomonadota bacterium]
MNDDTIIVIDIGAAQFESTVNTYDALTGHADYHVIAFEPDEEKHRELSTAYENKPGFKAIKAALGDGSTQTLNICAHPGRSSLLKPNLELAKLFDGFAEPMAIVDTYEIDTKRLDDVLPGQRADYIKIDTQGSELSILENAQAILEECLVVECEVEFIPQYQAQPLFAEIEQFLRAQGFQFHSFAGFGTHHVKPYEPGGNLEESRREGWIWADAFFIKDPLGWSDLPAPKLRRLATILTACMKAHDYAAFAEQVLQADSYK